MHGLDNMVIKEIPRPSAGAGNVVVSLEYVGICGSDVHYYHNGKCGAYEVNLNEDFMLGHECAGTVMETGEGVTELKAGDKVCLEPGIADRSCEYCKAGKYNLCSDMRFLATPPVQGCNMEYIEYPAEYCFKLPHPVSTREGALIEPLAVGFHAAAQGEVGAGETVVILGCGCIGLVTLLSCRARGAGRIIVADLVDARLDKARDIGADYVINSSKADVTEEVRRLTSGQGADKVFEAAGSADTLAQTPFLVKKGGMITLVGIAAQEEISYNFAQIMDKEVTIKSVFRYRDIYPAAIAAVSDGTIDIRQIITHEFDLEHIQEAYQEAVHNKTDMVKAVLKIK